MAQSYPYTYKLLSSVDFGSKKVDEINYREPKGKDMHGIRIGMQGEVSMGEFIKLFARISDQTPPFYDEVSAQDYINIMGLASDFLGSGQPTG